MVKKTLKDEDRNTKMCPVGNPPGDLPSGKRTVCYGKAPSLTGKLNIGKSTINGPF
jgi:hypothetical protein